MKYLAIPVLLVMFHAKDRKGYAPGGLVSLTNKFMNSLMCFNVRKLVILLGTLTV